MTFKEVLENRADKDGDKPFVYFRDQVVDFATLNRNANKMANSFLDLGIKKGDNVALFLPNCLEFLYSWFGLAKIGGVMVPLNVHLRGDGLKYIINHSESRLIVVHENLYDSFAFVEKELGKIEHRLWHGEGAPVPENFTALSGLSASAEDKAPPAIKTEDKDPLGIIYTSGTTGPPKGAMISHFNYLNSGQVWAEDVVQYTDQDIYFTCLPLFHANAQMFTTMGSLQSGRPYVLREKFSASRFFDEIREYGGTVFNYIGGILTMLMKQPEKENDADNPVRYAFGGGAPRGLWESFEKRFDLKIMEGFGLTESGGVSLCNTPNDNRMGSIGKPVRHCDVDIWNDDLQPLQPGGKGEIVVKEKLPYSIFLGYYNQPDKTEEAFKGGWFHTGDRGYKDEDGFFYFLDRVKDCIRRRGENISSFDVEKIVNSHPKVLESAAVAVPSELGEDEVKIYVVLQPNEELDPKELLAFCEKRMAYFMVPRFVEYLKEFPKTATERVQKFELRKRGVGDAWDREKVGYKLKKA
ncbi:MAG: ATP-dependent acyl-CoA ligase [Thermodesulfobacteriota bacterium]|nr:ATP-dependent acyl-CoA ligase [Thermodesulfobacteriota bacterium]